MDARLQYAESKRRRRRAREEATGYWLLAWAQRKRHDYNYNDSCWFPSCEVLTPCTTGRSESQHGGLYTQKEERVLHSVRGEGSATMKGENSATVKGEGSAFNLINQVRGGFQRRFLRNARVSSSTSDGTIRGTQYGTGGRRLYRTLMRWLPSET
jgi:hypothetical protein